MTLAVDLYGRLLGALEQDRDTRLYSFTYSEDAVELFGVGTAPLSLSLPVRSSPYESAACMPFFEGLLPEGIARQQLERTLQVSPGDGYGLLRHIGRDCAGAVVILSNDSPSPQQGQSSGHDWLDEDELSDLIATLPSRPLGISRSTPMRLSLAGVQSKLTLVRSRDGRFGTPSATRPSTHLIKPQYESGDFEDLVFNEYFCMSVARASGAEVAACELFEAGDHPCLLIKRFDRQLVGGDVRRLHQEDFCQALGMMPSRKYQADGGPSFGLLAQALRDVGRTEDISKLIRLTVLNYVLGNSDAHGKNFGLLFHDSSVRLAPAYDLVSTAVYEDLAHDMAMAIGDETDPTKVRDADWLDFAADCGVSATGLLKVVRETAMLVNEVAHRTAQLARAEGWHRPVIDRIVENCDARLELMVG